MEKASAKALEAVVKVSMRLECGEPADEIVQIEEEEGFNLIVMGAKRKKRDKKADSRQRLRQGHTNRILSDLHSQITYGTNSL